MEEKIEENKEEFHWTDVTPVSPEAAANLEKMRKNLAKLWRHLRENPPPPEFYEMLEHRGCWNDRLIR